MASSRKGAVKWNIPRNKVETHKQTAQKPLAINNDSVSENYIYSDTFEDQSAPLTYSDTFVSDSYSNTFVNGSSLTGNGSDKNGSTDIAAVISVKTSFDASEIQEATHLETARTEMLETVIEVDSDISYTPGKSMVKTAHDIDTTKDLSREHFDTYTSDSHIYSDTFESSERTKAESHYDETHESRSDKSEYSDSYSTRTYTGYTEEDESLLDRSYIAPDHDGKSLTDDENDDSGDTYDDDYSYTFEPTEQSTYRDPEHARIQAEQINIAEQAKKDFVKAMLAKLKAKPEKKFSQLESFPAIAEDVEEDDYLKHYCKRKIKLLKKKRNAKKGAEDSHDVSKIMETLTLISHNQLADYGLPDSVLERARIDNILTAMRRAAAEEIHEPSKCPDCREVKSRLDTEDAERQFVTAHAKRLKSKLMDAKVEEHLLRMNSISMIAELARELPRASERPEKIFDRLFEPLLGKNVMR